MKKCPHVVPQLLVALIVLFTGIENLALGAEGVIPMAPMKSTPELAPIKDAVPFSFIVFGDSQGDKGDKNGKLVIDKIRDGIIASQSTDNPVAFAINAGDLIVGEPPEGDITRDKLAQALKNARRKAAEFGVPVFNAPGNHELDDKDPEITGGELPSKTMREVYENVIGPTYGSFAYGNSHFVILNTEDLPTDAARKAFIESQKEHRENFPKKHPDITFHPREFSFIGSDQRLWLKAVLDANTDRTHVFIAMHYPVYPKEGLGGWGLASQLDDDSRDYLMHLLKDPKYANVSFVFASHQHLFFNHNDPDNLDSVKPFTAGEATRYMISGGAGAWKSVSAKEGGFFHYLKVNVDGKNVSVTIERMP